MRNRIRYESTPNVLENGRVATTPFPTPVRILLYDRKILERAKREQEVELDLLFLLAPQTGSRRYPLRGFILSSCSE